MEYQFPSLETLLRSPSTLSTSEHPSEEPLTLVSDLPVVQCNKLTFLSLDQLAPSVNFELSVSELIFVRISMKIAMDHSDKP